MAWHDLYKRVIQGEIEPEDVFPYIFGHAVEHEAGGGQPVRHDFLTGFNQENHRRINSIPALEIVEIEI